MLRRSTPLLALLVLLLIPGTSASASPSRPDVRAFARVTLAFDLSRGRAVGRAERRGDKRRSAALACLETLRAAPEERRSELFSLYFTYVSAGYFAEDEAIFARWVRALKRIRTADGILRSGRSALGAQLTFARRANAQGRAFCRPVQQWADAAWATSARPAAVRRLAALRFPASAGRTERTARLVESRGGAGRALAASVVRDGIDEPDLLIVQGDDPVVAVLAPTP